MKNCVFIFVLTAVFTTISAITQCPEVEGVQVYPEASSCDLFYLCINGSLTLERCPNGLLFDGLGEVTHFCRYNWQVECEGRENKVEPISTEHCPWLYGVFPISLSCNTQFHKCAEGEAFVTDCEPGLAYDDRIHACNWPDLLDGCDGEAIVGFQCPAKPRGLSARFYPHPRYPAAGDCKRYITCVDNTKPRLNSCGDDSGFNPEILACEELKNLPDCRI